MTNKFNPKSEPTKLFLPKPGDKKEEVKEEPRYTVEEVFYAIKEHCGKYDSPLGCEFEIKNLLKRFDEDLEYKEYLRLKAIYE